MSRRAGSTPGVTRPESTRAQEDRRLKVLVRASFTERPRLLRQPAHPRRPHRVAGARQPEADHSLDAGRGPESARAQAVQGHDDERSRSAGRRQSAASSSSRPTRPNQRWVGDTSEFAIGESGKLYLAVVLDLFSRFVVGWAVSAVNDRHLTIKALEMAVKRRCPEIGLLHHSDQGARTPARTTRRSSRRTASPAA